jgi:GNAT superfamily N-acetyltransferase
MQFSIRKGTKADIPAVFDLIVELAVYEKAPHEVTNSVEQMYKDGFGEHPLFGFFVAETTEKQIVGLSLYYYRYSTWKGKRLYLEDLIVTQEMRGHGLGEKLLQATITEAKDTQCTGVMWQVLDWNEPAIKFYERFGVRFDGEWVNVHLDV